MVKNNQKSKTRRSLMFPLLLPKSSGYGARLNDDNPIGHFLNIFFFIFVIVAIVLCLYFALNL
ncbi:hypothetical protein FD12_GL001311 [Lentilactobacillus rapi DSM 19907 = JCM 15042]|uniref:Uncharacterized protein n=2 Tax=Lentilactobacillus rapi TaxID=481723 RepID=A0A512PR69_9LACO|nr:hypothetical protein [Lentilactobacillus rapi]KRL13613.1 hypothetical protein FD12_GL001311 [Lentilactobacillus rapi DSM 19907 = JCM 15042]GEP73705.1 hypothetical protein LRA02_25730 [Lentilactobacillus rapi]